MNSNNFAQQSTGISPAMLNAFQNQQQPKAFTNALNPSQLMNGAGPMQQMGGSLNPAALQQQQQQQTSFNIHNMLNTIGMSREQFQALSTQDRHVLGQKYIQMVNQQHQHQNQGQLAQPQVTHPQGGPQTPYERPSSSASNQGPQQNAMLPPPPHRPPTAQGTAQISRPGTSFSHRSPTIPGSGPANLAAMMERPQSRLSHSDGLFKQGQNQPSQPQPPFPSSSTSGSTQQGGVNMGNLMNNMGMGNMMMNNMGMGVPNSPRIGGNATTAGAMGPPGLPRSVSGDGMALNMIGGGSMNMGGGGMNVIGSGMGVNMGSMSNVGGMGNMGMGMNGSTPRPQSSMGMGSGVGGMASSATVGGMGGLPGGAMGNNLSGMGMNMGMGMNVDTPFRTMPTSGNLGGQTQATPQTPIRQGSLPPQMPTNSQPQQSSAMGMSNIGAHSMRQNPMSAGTPSAVGGSGTQSSTQSRRQSLPPGGMGMSVNVGMGGISTTSATNSGPAPASPSIGINAGSTSIGSGIHGAAQPQPQIPPQQSQGSFGPSNVMPSATSANLGPTSASASGTASTASATSPAGSSTPIPSTSASASGSGVTPTSSSSASNLPHLAGLNPATTHITAVPLLTSKRHIPALAPSEVENVKKWMDVDREYDQQLRAMRNRIGEEVRELFKPALAGQPGQPSGKWLSTASPNWWERGGWGSTGSNWNRFRRPGREGFDVRYSNKRDALRGAYRSGRRGLRREGLKLPRILDPEEASKPEVLVPIRVEFDVEHHKMREAFIWNLNDPIVTPEIFAQSLVEDYNLSSSYHGVITKSIQDQLSDFHAHAFGSNVDDEMPISPIVYSASQEKEKSVLRGGLDDEDAQWWARWRRKLKREARKAIEEVDTLKGEKKRRKARANKREGTRQTGGLRKKRKTVVLVGVQKDDGDDDANILADNEMDEADYERDNDTMAEVSEDDEDDEWKLLSVDQIKVNEQSMHEDMRILIKLDIIIASIKLDDQFEWDLDNPMTSPEEFAEVYAQELGLSGEFKTAIAHSIREQVHAYQKSLFLVGHPSDGSAVQDEELKQAFLPSLTSGARPVSEVSLFTPLLNYLSDGEIERTEKEKDKELNKRRKRNTRGRRGIPLPDREPIRTYRTPAIGFPELDAATLALQAAANAPVSRRAAAAAASLTIANMVASENRDDNAPFMTQPITVVAPRPPPPASTQMGVAQPHHHPQQQKEKKGKGLFRAPLFPPSVLRHRANVSAPTPSTGADASLLPPGAVVDRDTQESGGHMSSQDARFNKIISAKRAKELEREAKEKEFVDGQHPNFIDGVWHCSNCGCPESIAVGRRKGPLGDKSQCGTCGKFWHRHRRPRPVEYNPDPNFHSGLKQKEIDTLKTPSTKKRGAAVLRAQNASAISTSVATPSSIAGADVSEPQTPAGKSNGDSKDKEDDDRPISPVSTASSASEAPLAHKVKVNGNHRKPSPVTVSTPSKTETTKASVSITDGTSGLISTVPAPSSPTKPHPPAWLSNAMLLMQAKYPTDRFEVILRKVTASSTPEWRIKCLDCPGKLYTPGPAETLSNYEVHLKNRQHRLRVNERLAGVVPASVSIIPGAASATVTVGAPSVGGDSSAS